MFRMEGELHHRKELNWSQLTTSDKSWSKLADDPIIAQADFVKLSDLFKSHNYNNSTSMMVA